MGFLKKSFSLDLRSLALFRLGVGLILVVDLVTRAVDLAVWYTDFGVLPREILIQKFMYSGQFSIHLLGGSLGIQLLLFGIALIAAIALTFGYRTRAASVISWLLLISLQTRNPMILQGGDVLLRLLCFWGIFLPWGACYSVDSALRASQKKTTCEYFSIGTVALIIQLVSVYVFAAFLKSGAEWRSDYTAVYYALMLDQFATPMAKFLRELPDFLKIMTFTVFWIEAVGWMLWFSPWAFERVRLWGVFLFVGLHLAFRICLDVGPFTWISILSLLVLLPARFWNFFEHKLEIRPRFKIFYDEDCRFCKIFVHLLKTFFILPQANILPASSEVRITDLMRMHNSWVVETGTGLTLLRFEAMIYVTDQALIRVGKVFSLFQVWGDRAYRWIAEHRKFFGRTTRLIYIQPHEIKSPKMMNVIATFFIFYVLWWNLGTLSPTFRMPRRFQAIGQLVRVDQFWNMFAPYPLKEDGWYVIPAKLKDGTQVDLFKNGDSLQWERPANIANTYKNERWRKYMMNLWALQNAVHRIYFAQYLCRSWNKSHKGTEELESFQIVFNLEIPLEGGRRTEPEKIALGEYSCIDFELPVTQ